MYSKLCYLIDNGIAGIYKGQRLDLRKFEVLNLPIHTPTATQSVRAQICLATLATYRCVRKS